MAIIKNVDGIDIEMTPQEEAEFLASLPQNVVPVPSRLSRRQFFQQLCIAGYIDTDQALTAAANGGIPSVFEQFIVSLPPDDQFGARMLIASAMEFDRNHPFVPAMAAMWNLSDADVDAFFIAGGAL